jgi:Ca2+-binding EF-hand superfamily protein
MAPAHQINDFEEPSMRNTPIPVLLLTLALPASAALAAPPASSSTKAPAATQPAAPTLRFAEQDADRDGQITRKEWKGNDISFAQQDTNGDGVLSGSEVAVAPAAPSGSTSQAGVHDRGRLERLFRKLDANRDGRLTPAELKATERFQRLDVNHDRIVSKDEYLKQ